MGTGKLRVKSKIFQMRAYIITQKNADFSGFFGQNLRFSVKFLLKFGVFRGFSGFPIVSIYLVS